MMDRVFRFKTTQGFHFARAFAERFGLVAENDRVILSGDFGEGFIQEVALPNNLALCIHSYTLYQPLLLQRLDEDSTGWVTIKFDCRRICTDNKKAYERPLFFNADKCEVEFGTSNFFTEVSLPAHQPIIFAVIGTNRENLLSLLDLDGHSGGLGEVLTSSPSFLFHEPMSPDMERNLKQLGSIKEEAQLSKLLYQSKILELMYLFFSKIIHRNTPSPLNFIKADVDKIYELRDRLVSDLSLAPNLPVLARYVGMSSTKMKALFKTIFGESIYQYFQKARMNQAAQLLSSHSVSEVAYKLGFENLSHFGRLFEKHYNIKPKRYKDTQNLV